MIGQRLSHYRIVEQVGAGGMGVVYRAHDEQLDRSVAVKVLPVGALADEAARARFRKEALTLAKLDHPNIATIFEFGSQDGVDFLVTAYIPGITLDAKLGARGLPEEEVIALGLQLTQGLAAAHERGIIHRDLKPANLRLTPEGLLKILDFGLARVTEPESELALTASITQSQEITGTLPYMAPEQLRSERIDARSDVWAAGAVLYEMATGQRPFPETQGPVLISAILNGNPRPPKELNPKISTGLENVVLKALEKNPVHRYQTARDLRVDLERLAAGTGPAAKPRGRRRWLIAATVVVLALLLAIGSYFTWRPGGLAGGPRRSVAVLGFKNLAGKPEKAWMSTALSEMLTTELGVGGQLRTISGENVSRMKADLSLADSDSLAKENLTRVYQMLGSDIVVLGSYLDLGGRIRVDLRVQDTSAGETIATASEVGSEEQFFELVKRLGESLREKCGAGELTAEQQAATRALEPTNTEAARLYAEGLAKLRAFDAAGAKSLLQRAVRADPKHALAHSALAAAWSQLGYDEYAQVTSKTAYELSKGLPRNEALAIEARYREHNYEWDKAAEIYRSLWTFYPDDLEYGLRFANAQSSAGKGLDALVTVQSLRNLPRPLRDDPRIGMAEATAAESLGDYRREQAATARVIEGAGRHGMRLLAAQALVMQCWALRNLGELGKAKSAAHQAMAAFASAGDSRGEALSATCIGNVLADEGKLSDAKAMHEKALALARNVGAQKDIAGALINLGNILADQQNPLDSTKQYRQALSVATEIADKPDALIAQNNIAANLMLQGEFAGAEPTLQQALQTAREIGDQSGLILALTNLGIVAYNQADFATARKYLDDALAKSRQVGMKSSTASALVALGDLFMAQDNLSAAEKSYQESLQIWSQTGEQGGVATSRLSLAGLALEKNDSLQALGLARDAATEFQAENNHDLEARARNVVAQALMMQGNTPAANAAYEDARRLAPADASVKFSLDITSAVLAGRRGNRRQAAEQLAAITARAKQAKLPGYELQARLAEAQVPQVEPSGRAQLQRLEKDSTELGYILLARKASELLKAAK